MTFSGRETAVIRAIDFSLGTTGEEITARTRLEAEEAVDIINGLLDIGFVETNPPQQEHVETDKFPSTKFEINPAYAHELKSAVARR